MLEKDKLRKTDIYSGAAICLFGLWIILQALKMPMKDSWGGVQNVWYVSPAIFPLFVGCMIMLLGALLCRTALKMVGFKAFGEKGEKFDPERHDALVQNPNPEVTEAVVADVVELGYLLGERMLRPAKVAVFVPAE